MDSEPLVVFPESLCVPTIPIPHAVGRKEYFVKRPDVWDITVYSSQGLILRSPVDLRPVGERNRLTLEHRTWQYGSSMCPIPALYGHKGCTVESEGENPGLFPRGGVNAAEAEGQVGCSHRKETKCGHSHWQNKHLAGGYDQG